MADKIIAATLQVDTGTSNANIKEVGKNLTDVKTGLRETGATAATTGKQVEGSTGSFVKLKEGMSALPGPLGQAGEGVNKLGTAFKALLANPVVLLIAAIVAALALLYKAFTNTFEGGEKMEQVFAGIKAAGQSLLDNLSKIGNAIVKLFEFDFSGAVDEINGVVKAAGDAYNAMSDLTEQAQKLAREQATNDLDQAKRAAKLAQLREQATDESIPVAKRKAALKELQVAAEADAKTDIDLAKRTAENKIAQLELEKDGNKKNFVEIQKIKTDQVNGQTESANELRRIGKQVTAAERQEIAERKAANAEADAKRKKDIEEAKQLQKTLVAENLKATNDLLEIERQKHAENLKILKKGNQDTFAEITRYNNAVNVITAKSLADSGDLTKKIKDDITAITAGALAEVQPRREIVINQTQFEKDQALARMTMATIETEHRKSQVEEVKGLLTSLADIVGKQTIAGKALGIATALINTYQGATEALKQKSTLPSPFDIVAKVINVAAVIATGLKAVKAIAAVNVPGGGGGGSIGSPPSISVPAAPIAPTQSSTSLDQATLNGIGNATSQPVKAYVVESEGANTRERIERLNRQSRLGG